MMVRYLTILLLSMVNSTCCAQHLFALKGLVRDPVSKKPLSYTMVSIKHTNQATTANENGNFSFSFVQSQNDIVVFSLMGYHPKEILINTLSNSDSLIVELDVKAFDLPVTEIPGLAAKEVVRKAIRNLKQSFPDSNLILQSFYRQYHKEDNQYVRLLEAIVITKEQPYRNYMNSIKSEKVFIKALRRSDVTEENKAQHGDHLIDLLNENLFKFPTGSVLNLKGIDYFQFHFAESNSPDEIAIEFSTTLSSADKIPVIVLLIYQDT